MAERGAMGRMGLFRGGGVDEREQEIARLKADLEKTQLRLEEVAAYYRGELEAARQRGEEEAVRTQAAEVGRRRRAEEQVAHLKGELKAARSEAAHAQRRYNELLQRLQQLEQESEDKAREEVDRQQDAARAAWQTAEEEMAHLEREVGELQRLVERGREERIQLERTYEQALGKQRSADEERQRLIVRLKRALKLSEQRRKAVEQTLASGRSPQKKGRFGGYGAGNPREISGLNRVRIGSEASTVEVDPGAGWGDTQIGTGGDISDEFMMVEADQSFREPADEPRPSSTAQSGREDVSDAEAEELMMTLAVEQKVARRQAEQVRQGKTPRPSGSAATRPAPARPAQKPGRKRKAWRWIVAAGTAAAAGLVVIGWGLI